MIPTKTLVAALVLASGLAAPLAAQEGGHAGHGAAAGAMPMSPASSAYMEAMTRMDDAMRTMPMTGKPGHDFAAMMIPHHRAAIEMAEAYLASGDADPELTKMANDVVAAQKAEIATLEAWLAKHPVP
ncbi:DUF305 domain-containing protein [Antarcticirhabdus aurantiaca]|uniref:DUF305 domain-containing protein n=1 Tax=Antarcticirhabdus aurantiaca TaxID=2606717 RepID=A0ACD4NLY0_9HYPH|nr:DUF305 domain-containing protein [Antarcticirhabdus aurantiaca]WAJ27772.1 DUF305 domain-containing protein [Jeongeuplla avenae]